VSDADLIRKGTLQKDPAGGRSKSYSLREPSRNRQKNDPFRLRRHMQTLPNRLNKSSEKNVLPQNGYRQRMEQANGGQLQPHYMVIGGTEHKKLHDDTLRHSLNHGCSNPSVAFWEANARTTRRSESADWRCSWRPNSDRCPRGGKQSRATLGPD
jgi:hypothetical protein